MFSISVDGFEDGCCKLLAKLLAFVVNVAVGTPAEVDALEGTTALLLCLQDGFHSRAAILVYDECLACRQLLNLFTCKVKGCLQYSTLAGHGNHLVVLMPKGRTDAPRVAHGKHLAAASHAAHHVAAVVVRHRGT